MAMVMFPAGRGAADITSWQYWHHVGAHDGVLWVRSSDRKVRFWSSVSNSDSGFHGSYEILDDTHMHLSFHYVGMRTMMRRQLTMEMVAEGLWVSRCPTPVTMLQHTVCRYMLGAIPPPPARPPVSLTPPPPPPARSRSPRHHLLMLTDLPPPPPSPTSSPSGSTTDGFTMIQNIIEV